MYDGTRARCDQEDQWLEKNPVERPIDVACADSWFDVRVSAAIETTIADVPEAVRHARRKAALLSARARTTSPYGIASMPHTVRQRERRSIRFSDAPAWRVDFTVVEVSRRHMSMHNGTGVAEATMDVDTAERHEIEIELDRAVTSTEDSSELRRQCERVVERIRTALGSTPQEVRDRLRRDIQRSEIMHVMSTSI
jgi:hypothetical protein